MSDDLPDPYLLYTLAHDTLDAIVDNWPSEHEPPPDRRYVHVGTPAADAAQLVVWVPRTLGAQGNAAQQQMVTAQTGLIHMRALVLIVQVLRDVPAVQSEGVEIELPTPETLDKAARLMLGDAQAVLNAVIAAHLEPTSRLGGVGNLSFDTWEAVSPAGFLAGGEQRLRFGTWG